MCLGYIIPDPVLSGGLLTYQQSQVIDGETLENVGEAGVEVNRLVVEHKHAGQVA